MKNLKRVLGMVLALAIVVSTVAIDKAFLGARADSYDSSLVNQFTDIKGHWASDGLTNLIGYGYMRGIGNNQAAPNETITTAQLVALLVRIMGGSEEADLSGYADMDPKAWYYSEMAQGLNMGIVPNTNTNYLNPKQEASREYAAYMLCRAFGLTVREPIDDYTDADKVSDWAVSSMQAMVAAEAIVGTDGRNGRYLNPQEAITRAEFSQMIYRLNRDFVKDGDSTNISKQTFDNGLLISKSGATLTDCTIKGNLYIADSVGSGNITLKNTKVEGNIYARGGGDHSIHLEGDTTANSVVLINPYMATRLVVGEDVEINGVLVNNGKDKVTLEGEVGNVTVNVSDVDLELDGAVATNVIINSRDSLISVDKDSTVETLSIASSSSGAKIESKGTVKRLALMANSAELNLSGKLDYLLIGAVSDLKLDLDSSIVLGALDLHCSDSTIAVDSEVKSINVSAFSEKLSLELGKNAEVVTVGIASPSAELKVHADAEIGSVTIDAPKYKGTISSTLTNLTIGAAATEAEITLDSDADITNMFVNADKVKVITDSKAVVKDLNVTGKEVTVEGKGAVERVNAAISADSLTVTTGDTAVANVGAEKVTAGGVEVPAGKTYVTTSDGKDVVRNNDGTPDGDGDKTTGADQEIATVANFQLSFAKDAQADDIDPSRNWTLSNLVENISFTKNTNKGAAYVMSGNVKKVEQFTPVYDPIGGYGTGYYVPLIVDAEFMENETDWVVTVNGVTYNKDDLSKGAGYKDKLIVFLQLSQGTASRVATVTMDRDGAGKKFSPVTIGVDYSAVTFDGVQDNSSELFSYPTRAAKDDLTTNGAFELADFGAMTLNKTQDNTYSASGDAKFIAAPVVGNVVLDGQTNVKHYLPVMINTTGFQNNWSVATDGGTRFNATHVSQGTNCKGNLVVLLGLGINKNFYTFYIDKDGDGRSDASYVLNVGLVKLGTEGDTPVVTTRLSYPANTNSGDLSGTGISDITDLGNFGLTLNHMAGKNNVLLSGGATKLAAAPRINVTSTGAEYYYPLLIDTTDFTGNWTVSTSIGGNFNRSNTIVYGGHYYGKLLVFVALPEPNQYSKFATISIDKTGNGVTDETWNLFSSVTLGTVTPDQEVEFGIPTLANDQDLQGTGLDRIGDLGTFSISKKTTYHELTGTATKLDKVIQNTRIGTHTGYYFPLLVNTRGFTGNWSIKASTGETFSAANAIPTGPAAYGGSIILYLALPTEGSNEGYLTVLEVDKNGDGVTDTSVQFTSTVTLLGEEVDLNNFVYLALNGNAVDFAGTDFERISDFGTFKMTHTVDGGKELYTVTGTANYIEQMGGNALHANQHHYVPMVIDTTGFSDNWSVSGTQGETYNRSDLVANGGAYVGKLVVFADLYHANNASSGTCSMSVDYTGDGVADTTITIKDTCTLLPKEEEEVPEDYGTIPDNLNITIDERIYKVSVFDLDGDIINKETGAVNETELVRVIKAKMLEQGFVGMSHVKQGTKYSFMGTKGGVPRTFDCDLDTDVRLAFAVRVHFPGGPTPYTFIPDTDTTTVQAMINAYLSQAGGAQNTVGSYYFKGAQNTVAKPIADAANDEITEETDIYIGYHKVTIPVDESVTINGLSVTGAYTFNTDYDADKEGTEFYVRYGETVQLDISLNGTTEKAGGTATINVTGAKWTVKNALADTVKGAAVVVNEGSDTITITTAYSDSEANDNAVDVACTYTLTVGNDIAISMSSQAAE